MLRILFAVVVVLFVGSLCFAQQAPVAPKQATHAIVAHKTVSGKVKSATLADAAKGKSAELQITESTGAELQFKVLATAVITDKEQKPVTLDKLAVGEEVSVKYTVSSSGVKEAVTIKVTG